MDEKQLNPETKEQNAARQDYDATLDDDSVDAGVPEGMTEEELQESLLEEDSSLNGFQKRCARIKDDVWMKIQIAAGIVMGLGTALALFWNNVTGRPETSESAFSIPLIVALVIALAGPNIIEKQTARKIPKGRVTMAITLGAVVVIYFLVAGMRSGFKFN